MDKKKILIVDDVASNIHLLSNILKDEYTIIAATKGKKAIELAQKFPYPDLILLDIVMPEIDGYEVCKILKESNDTKNIPIIFVSSLNDIKEHEKALEYGGADFLVKPISKNILKSRIKMQIDLQDKKIKKEQNSSNVELQEKKKNKILIVDDAPQNIQVAVEILKNDYIISVATSGQKALDILEDGLDADLILLDIVMPNMDGFEVCRRLNSNPKFNHIPIMFLTILENEKDMIEGLELGAVDYVTKPFEPKVLKARVDTHIKLKNYNDMLLANLKEKDELLVQQTKLATLGSMFENITHQWKQPLSVISVASSGIKLNKDMDNLTDEFLIKMIDEIHMSADYLSQTIDDFRDFLSEDTKKQYFKVKTIIQRVIQILNSKIKNRVIEIEINGDDIEICTFKNELIQVLMNIFTNAIRILDKKENNRKIKVSLSQENNKTYINISDNGGGVPQENIDRIFEKYFSTKENDKNSGLGLYMSKKMVEEHLLGNLTVKNQYMLQNDEESKGACFTISL